MFDCDGVPGAAVGVCPHAGHVERCPARAGCASRGGCAVCTHFMVVGSMEEYGYERLWDIFVGDSSKQESY